MRSDFVRLERRQFLQGAAALAGTIPFQGVLAATSELSFLVVGDWGEIGVSELRVAGAMAWCAANTRVRFVISVGDNFYDRGVTDAEDPQWLLKYEQVFAGEALEVPWYAVLGNHDYLGNPEAEIRYSERSARWRMPAHYYKIREALADGSRADFFFIDTNMFIHPKEAQDITGINARAQSRWLADALAASDAQWKFVVGHHPVFSGGERHGDTGVLIRELKPLFDRHKVKAYFNGHDHNLQHIAVDGVHYLTSGSGSNARAVGAESGTVFAASTLGFIDAQFQDGKLRVEFIDAARTTIHSFEIMA